MISDPIIEEIYIARQKLLDECGNDLKKLMKRLRGAESQHPDQVVSKTSSTSSESSRATHPST